MLLKKSQDSPDFHILPAKLSLTTEYSHSKRMVWSTNVENSSEMDLSCFSTPPETRPREPCARSNTDSTPKVIIVFGLVGSR